jgi:hypothetical protein
MAKRSAGNSVLIFTAFISVFVSLHQSGWNISATTFIFEMWILLPFYVCWLFSLRLYRVPDSKYATIALLFSLFALLFLSVVYSSFYFGHQSSTGALVFIFIPFYMLVAEFLVLGAAIVIQYLQNRKSKGDGADLGEQ